MRGREGVGERERERWKERGSERKEREEGEREEEEEGWNYKQVMVGVMYIYNSQVREAAT